MEDKQRAERADKFVERKYTSERLAAKGARKAKQVGALRLAAGNEVAKLSEEDVETDDDDVGADDEDSDQ